ncbi:hypothetical protein O7627_07190 [Solwaraspora sp. WMMD1047]|uniref:uridine kinase family protein n=1 Tax=Solwaraspora sp. WMMD1047 TaxID=3016102 RepID=UPI002416A95F|nr:hypothetical protein [Solwaraspora sp. WMMD1047]MDG4829088.1 hypothetical protein [Solwaraspora sp. WMMD1047]
METYRELAGRIRDLPPTLGPCRLIAVDGPSGAGKSRFARRLAAASDATAGPDPGGGSGPGGGAGPGGPAVPAEPGGRGGPAGGVPVVCTDDLLDGWDDQLTFWPRLQEWVLGPLRAGRPGRYRRYSWVRREFTPGWITVPAAPVVIVEGVSSARAEIAPELALGVFVTAPAGLRLDRVLSRDGAALAPYLENWRRGEDAHFAADRTATRADLVVDGAPAVPHNPDTEYVRLVS